LGARRERKKRRNQLENKQVSWDKKKPLARKHVPGGRTGPEGGQGEVGKKKVEVAKKEGKKKVQRRRLGLKKQNPTK